MKKIFYYIAALLVAACTPDSKEDVVQGNNPLKELTPPTIVVKQGNQLITDAFQNGKIVLSASQEYRVEITFAESVELLKGDFLKVKSKNNKEYFADFYGRNIKEIEEKVTFRKEGYKDYTLEIVQQKVIPNFYIEVENRNDEGSYVTTSADKKTIKVLNTQSIDIDVDILFFAPIVLENQTGVEVQRMLDGSKYNVKVNPNLLTTAEVQLPIYTMVDEQKGKLIGEIVFVAENIPYYQEPSISWYPYVPNVVYYERDSQTELDLNFVYFLNQQKPVFIDNINTQYVKEVQLDKNDLGAVKVLLQDEILTAPRNRVHFFDVYEGELVSGEIQKKQNAEKREIILRILGW